MTSNFNADLVKEVNELRTNPKKYAEKVQTYTKYFKGKVLRIPGTNTGIKTEEGVNAYNDAVEFLTKQPNIEPLDPSKGMCKIAEDLLYEVQNRDPSELNDIDMEAIIAKYGNFYGNFARAVDFGGANPEHVIVNLIVSDGDPSRSQRESLLSKDLRRVGVANGKHAYYRHCSIIVCCTKFENTIDSDDVVDFKTTNNENGNNSKKKVTKNAEVKNEDKNKNVVEELPEGCISVNRTEKFVEEGGVKKKVIRIVRMMDDGTKEVETIKEPVEE